MVGVDLKNSRLIPDCRDILQITFFGVVGAADVPDFCANETNKLVS